ncbi:MAG: TetR/AcrR family transcriptional regulator [Candidatus Sericytochromatia bacterium]
MKKILTQEKVMLAAEKIFGEKGFHAGTTKEIAEEAGVAEGTIFKYFKSKKDLLIGIVGPIVTKNAQSIIYSRKDEPIRDILVWIARDRVKFLKSIFPVMKVVLFEGQIDNTFRQTLFQEITSNVAKHLETLFAEKIKKGEIKSDLDPFIITRTFMPFVFGTALINEISNGAFFEPLGIDNTIPQSIDIFLKGIEK